MGDGFHSPNCECKRLETEIASADDVVQPLAGVSSLPFFEPQDGRDVQVLLLGALIEDSTDATVP